jgi:hypothetical protein
MLPSKIYQYFRIFWADIPLGLKNDTSSTPLSQEWLHTSHIYTPEFRLDVRPVVCSETVADLETTNKSFLLYKTENEVLSYWDMLLVLLTFMCFIFTSCFCTMFTLPKLIRLHNLNTEMLSFRSWFTACKEFKWHTFFWWFSCVWGLIA